MKDQHTLTRTSILPEIYISTKHVLKPKEYQARRTGDKMNDATHGKTSAQEFALNSTRKRSRQVLGDVSEAEKGI